jgi:hypothetical protein
VFGRELFIDRLSHDVGQLGQAHGQAGCKMVISSKCNHVCLAVVENLAACLYVHLSYARASASRSSRLRPRFQPFAMAGFVELWEPAQDLYNQIDSGLRALQVLHAQQDVMLLEHGIY